MIYKANKIDNIAIINGDAIEVLKSLINRKMVFDCIVTDPPYPTTARGCAGNSGGMLQKDINKRGQVFKHNSCDVKEWGELCYTLLKDGGHAYIMTNHVNLINYLNTLTNIGFHFIKSLIWNKGNKIMGQFYMSQFEYILFFRKGKAVKINNCGTSDILDVPNKKHKDEKGSNLHDTEKPVELMKILIENSTKEHELILEPFMGIGAVPIACKELNRHCIACELDENYYNIAKERIENEINR